MALTSNFICLYITTIFITQSTITYCANIDYLTQTLKNHFADTRYTTNDRNRTKKFIYQEFQGLGLDTVAQSFKFSTSSPVQHKLGCNVIGVLKGVNFGKSSDRILGIVAHYDTVTKTKGVDENGSGVAAMLEVARQIHEEKLTPDHTVIFLASDGEDFSGSDEFIKVWLPSWRQKHYTNTSVSEGYIVLDSVMNYNTTQNSQIVDRQYLPYQYFPTAVNNIKSDGFKGDFLSLIYRKTPDAELADNFRHSWEAEGRPRFEIESFPLPLNHVSRNDIIPPGFGDFTRSDHFVFWEANIPAIFITDTADMRGFMNYCYHKSCDNVENLVTEDNLRFLGKIADALVQTIKHNGVPWSSGNKINSNITMTLALSTIIAFLRFI